MRLVSWRWLLRSIALFLPRWLLAVFLKIYMQNRYDLRIGRNSLVRPECFFEGHNTVLNDSDVAKSTIGRYTYIANHSNISSAKVGRFCSIGDYVRTELGRHPASDFVSTHPAFFSSSAMHSLNAEGYVDGEKFNNHVYIGDSSEFVVEIGNDVWIGNNVLIMDGVHIGDGAIVAAGSIVTKDVPPYTIVAGVPAKRVRNRFSEPEVDFLLHLKWWNMVDEKLEALAPLFHDIRALMKKLKKDEFD